MKISNKITSYNLQINKRSMGFTLIELLIVMAIIALLSGLSIFAMQNARKQGRDGRRKADLEVIRSAMEIYKADCSQYPASLGTSIQGTCAGSNNTYLQLVPKDPTSNNSYAYSPAGSPPRSYVLCTHLEDPPTSPNITGCGTCSPAPCGYRTINP